MPVTARLFSLPLLISLPFEVWNEWKFVDCSETLEEGGGGVVIVDFKEGRKESNTRDWFYTGVKKTARTKYPPIHLSMSSSKRHPSRTKGNRCGGVYLTLPLVRHSVSFPQVRDAEDLGVSW